MGESHSCAATASWWRIRHRVAGTRMQLGKAEKLDHGPGPFAGKPAVGTP